MSHNEIISFVTDLVRKNYLVGKSQDLDPAESLIATGTVDSTGILELITFLEESFKLQFDDDELTAKNFGTIDGIATFLSGKLRTNGASE